MVRSGSAASTACRTQLNSVRPAARWSTLGSSDRIRVPFPAARTTACTDKSEPLIGDFAGGAGLEPALTGPKPVVLPITPPPKISDGKHPDAGRPHGV